MSGDGLRRVNTSTQSVPDSMLPAEPQFATASPPGVAAEPVARPALERLAARLGPEWTRAWLWGGTIWITSRIGTVIALYFGLLLGSVLNPTGSPAAVAAGGSGVTLASFASALQHLDANWYLSIATNGYSNAQTSAFFPLYPLLIHVLSVVLPWLSPLACGLLLSNVALLAALVLLVRLTERELGARAGQHTALLFVAFPAAFSLTIPYTESLFLALVLGAFLALRTGRWTAAGVLAAAATLARPSGGFLIFAFAWEYLRQSPVSFSELRARGLSWARWRDHGPALATLFGRLLALAGMPVAVAGYAGYLWMRLGNPVIFLKAQRLYWNHIHTLPTGGFALALGVLGRHPFSTFAVARDLLDAVPTFLVLVVLLLGIRRLPVAYTLFSLAVLTLALIEPIPNDEPLQSGIRYVLSTFPVFMLLGAWSERWPSLRPLLLYTWLPLQGILFLLYIYGHGMI